MGKGDQRSRRGKIHRGTYGKSRKRADNKKQSGGKGSTDAKASAPAQSSS